MGRILELFSGTKSISKVFAAHGWRVFTIDNNSDLNPDFCINMLDFDISMLPEEWRTPDIIWASPPCTAFSIAGALYKNWRNGKPISEKAHLGLALVCKAKEIIELLKPRFWYIENPRGMLRKQKEMFGYGRRVSVTYCKYGDSRQKPTDIWTNNYEWIPRRPCRANSKCHIPAPRGSKTGTQGLENAKDRGVIPPGLCEEIFKISEELP
jgi:hypothetical protein